MFEITCRQRVTGELTALWETWTDLESFPSWDEREAELRLDAPFAVGATGWSRQHGRRPGTTFTVTAVEPMTRWVNQCPLPFGRLVIEHLLVQQGDQVDLTKRYEVHGPMSVAFRFAFARSIRLGAVETLQALGREAARRSLAQGTP